MLRRHWPVGLGFLCAGIWIGSAFSFALPETHPSRNYASPSQPTKPPRSSATVSSPDFNASTHPGDIPLGFVANRGQSDPLFDYISDLPGISVGLSASGAVLTWFAPIPHNPHTPVVAKPPARTPRKSSLAGSGRLSLTLIGGGNKAVANALDDRATKVSYFVGSNPASWIRNAPTTSTVRYDETYPGVSITYHGSATALEYDFAIAPGSNPKVIRVRFTGADALQLDSSGDLLIKVPGGQVRQAVPLAYQEKNGSRNPVEIGYEVTKEEFGFRVGSFDPTLPLIIDPVVTFSNVFGSLATASGNALARDSAGFLYVAGEKARVSANRTINEALVAKLDPSGSVLTQFLFGGAVDDSAANGIAVDANGNIYVVGTTSAPDFPTTQNAFKQRCTLNGGCGKDAFLLKMDPTGALLYSTFFGGSLDETGNALALDGVANAYITGLTVGDTLDFRAGIPVKGGFKNQITPASCTSPGATVGVDAYVAKFDLTQAGANSLVYSSMLGGGGDEEGTGIAAFQGMAYISGLIGNTSVMTQSNCTAESGPLFPTTSNAVAADDGRSPHAFFTAVNSSGNGIQYSTILPGSVAGRGVAVDTTGLAYLTGSAIAGLPVTANAAQASFGGGTANAFVSKINPFSSPPSSSLVYATYVGGSVEDVGEAIAVDSSGRASITGLTSSSNFPVTPNAIQRSIAAGTCGGTPPRPCPDAFITRVSPDGSSLNYSTYLGGTNSDEGRGIALGLAKWFITGGTSSPNFPHTLGQFVGTSDVFVASVIWGADLSVTKTAAPSAVETGQLITYTITVTNNGPDDSPDVLLVDTPGFGSQEFFSSLPWCTNMFTVISCDLGPLNNGSSTTETLSLVALKPGALTNDVTVSGPVDDPNPQNNSATVSTTSTATADMSVSVSQTPPNPVDVGTQGTYTITVANNGPDLASTIVLNQIAPTGLNIVSASTPQGTCIVTPTGLKCIIPFVNGLTVPGLIGVPSSVPIAVVFTPTSAGNFSVQTNVNSLVPDPNPANNANLTTTVAVVAALPKLSARLGPASLSPLTRTVTVLETFTNSGAAVADDVVLQQTSIQTTGAGSMRILSPQMPVSLGNLASGARISKTFVLEFSGTVRDVTISQTGTMEDAQGGTIPFSINQNLRIP